MTACRAQLRVQHVVLDAKLRIVGGRFQSDHSGRRIEIQIDTRGYDVAPYWSGFLLRAGPVEETKPKDKLNNFTLLLDLGVPVKEFGINLLNLLAAIAL